MYQGPPPPFVPGAGGASNSYGGAPLYGGGGGYGSGSYGGSSRTSEKEQDKLAKAVKDPILNALKWIQSRNQKEKTLMGVLAGLVLLFILWRTIQDHDTLFVLAEIAHFVGIGVLGYKVTNKKSVAGISLQSQILTAVFLGIRLYCSFMMEYDIHTILDMAALAATLFVLYIMLATPVKQTYQPDLDILKWYYVLLPCIVLSGIAHPDTTHWFVFRMLWALCVFLEAVSVLPQLRMMQKGKVVERFTAHYVFLLGLSRFFSCAHWILQLLEGNKYLYSALGRGLWPVMVLLSEVVQTFILADFCYYYLRSYADGSGLVRLPVGIV